MVYSTMSFQQQLSNNDEGYLVSNILIDFDIANLIHKLIMHSFLAYTNCKCMLIQKANVVPENSFQVAK